MKLYNNLQIVDLDRFDKNSISKSKIVGKTDDLMARILNGKIVTHSGQFHADEIFCVALILIIRDSNKKWDYPDVPNIYELYRFAHEKILEDVIRRPQGLDPHNEEDAELYNSAVVIDILNGHFDHHHVDINDAPTLGSTRIASIGALWNYIGHIFDIKRENVSDDIPHVNVYERMWENLFSSVSLVDVYGPNKYKSDYSLMISNINGYTAFDFDFVVPDEDDMEGSKFVEAVLFAYKIIRMQLIKEQNFIRSLHGIGGNEYIEMDGNGVPSVTIKVVPEGEKEPKVNTETLKYVKVDGTKTPRILVNKNPSLRDGSCTVVCVNSEEAHLDGELLKNPAPGQRFVHPALFMATFDTVENVEDFVSKLKFDDENRVLKYCRE